MRDKFFTIVNMTGIIGIVCLAVYYINTIWFKSFYYVIPDDIMKWSVFGIVLLNRILTYFFVKTRCTREYVCFLALSYVLAFLTCDLYLLIAYIVIFGAEFFIFFKKDSKWDFLVHTFFYTMVLFEITSVYMIIRSWELEGWKGQFIKSLWIDVLFIVTFCVYDNRNKILDKMNGRRVLKNKPEFTRLRFPVYDITMWRGLILGIFFGFRLYSGLFLKESLQHALLMMFLMAVHIFLLYLLVNECMKGKSRKRMFLSVIAGFSVPTLYVCSFSLSETLISLGTIFISYVMIKYMKQEAVKWLSLGIFLLVQSVVCAVYVEYAFPAFNILACIVLCRFSRKYRKVIAGMIVCFIVAGQSYMEANSLSLEKKYHELIGFCKNMEGICDVNFGYRGEDDRLLDILFENDIPITDSGFEEDTENSVMIYDASSANLLDMLCLYEDARVKVVCKNGQIAEAYRENGGDYYLISGNDTVEVERESGNLVKVTLNNIYSGYHDVSVAVWNGENGQDDIIWYPIWKNIDGIYQIEIDLSVHPGADVTYFHVYGYYENDEQPEMIGASTNGEF